VGRKDREYHLLDADEVLAFQAERELRGLNMKAAR
jgi:hypothetical protein